MYDVWCTRLVHQINHPVTGAEISKVLYRKSQFEIQSWKNITFTAESCHQTNQLTGTYEWKASRHTMIVLLKHTRVLMVPHQQTSSCNLLIYQHLRDVFTKANNNLNY